MKNSRSRWFTLMSILWVVGAFAQPPEYELDLHWPKIPMGDNWLTGGIGGMCIDQKDHVYLLNRQNVCLLYTSPSPRDATLSRMPGCA